MKKAIAVAALLLTPLLVLPGCGGHPGRETLEAPGYPWDITADEVKANLEAEGLDYTVLDDGRLHVTECEPLFGLPTKDLNIAFSTKGPLEGVSWQIDEAHKDDMIRELKNYLGEPVTSYCPAQIDILWENFSVFLASNCVTDDTLIWHSEDPLSETWTEEARANFEEGYKENSFRNNGTDENRFADAPDSTARRSGEDVTVWHGSRAFEQWFANNWEKTVTLQPLSATVWLVSSSFLVAPF